MEIGKYFVVEKRRNEIFTDATARIQLRIIKILLPKFYVCIFSHLIKNSI